MVVSILRTSLSAHYLCERVVWILSLLWMVVLTRMITGLSKSYSVVIADDVQLTFCDIVEQLY